MEYEYSKRDFSQGRQRARFPLGYGKPKEQDELRLVDFIVKISQFEL